MDREIAQSRNLRSLCFAVAMLAMLLGLGLFIDVLAGEASLAFRDVSHFYHPLQIYLHEHRGDSWFPLWSPLDSFGVPLAGETAPAVFYPPRILLSKIFSPFVAVGLYVVVHLFWAGFGVFKLATSAKAHSPFATTAAISYAFSGSVFFLYTNPPFLVGAAWLPWIVFNLTRPSLDLSKGIPANLMLAACCIAMSILGGDPQTPINALLLLGMLQLGTSLRPKRRSAAKLASADDKAPAESLPSKTRSRNYFRLRRESYRPWLNLLFAIALAGLLALPQIAAGLSWSSHSHRRATQPQTLVTLIQSQWFDSANIAPQSAEPFTIRRHENELDRYSIAPWHLLELVSPYVSGNLFPTNGRISKLISGEPGMWTPTLYCGLLPSLSLFFGLLQHRHWNRWLAMAIISCLFALGQFGFYWHLVHIIPGYGQFRFPAKWLPLVTLGIVMYAAIMLTNMKHREWHLFNRLILIFFIVGIFLTTILSVPPLHAFLIEMFAAKANLISDRFWGPLRLGEGVYSLQLSLLQTTLLSGGIYLASKLFLRQRLSLQMFAICCLTIATADILLAAKWQLSTIPTASLLPGRATETKPAANGLPKRFILTQSANPWPATWRTSADSDRMNEVEAAHRQTWFSRWHLADDVAVLNNVVSIPAHRAAIFWSALNAYTDNLSPSAHRNTLATVGAHLSIDAFARRDEGQLTFIPVPAKRPFVRWYSSWNTIAPISAADLPTAMLEHINSIDLQGEKLIPQVEVDRDLIHNTISSAIIASTGSPVTSLQINAEQIKFNVSASQAGFVQIMQMQEGGWRAYLKPQLSAELQTSQDWIATQVYPADMISQGLFVPEGNWKVLLVYQPTWYWPCGLLAGSTWLVIIVTLCGTHRSQRRKSP